MSARFDRHQPSGMIERAVGSSENAEKQAEPLVGGREIDLISLFFHKLRPSFSGQGGEAGADDEHAMARCGT